VCTVYQKLEWVGIAPLDFGLHLAGYVVEEAAHAESANFFRFIWGRGVWVFSMDLGWNG